MRQATSTTAERTPVPEDGRTRRRHRVVRAVASLTAAAVLSVTAGGAAVADDLWNTLDGTSVGAATLDPQAELVPLQIGKKALVAFRLQARNSSIDGFEGCNVAPTRPAIFTFRSTNPDVAVPVNTSIEFTACSSATLGVQEKTIEVVAKGAGTTTFDVVSVLDAAGKPFTSGSFVLSSASFRVDVAPPPNSAPTMEVLHLDQREYPKGSQPSPICRMTDAEEGTKEFPASLVKKVEGGDGLGTWMARCFYRDGQGAIALATPEYTVIDPTSVVVRYFVNTREGDQPWIRSDVRLQWVVEDPEGPSHVRKTPGTCEDQNVLSDGKHEFVCEAHSFDGKVKRIVATLKRDATGPVILPTITSTPISVNGVTWYKGNATIDWTMTDDHSGPVESSLRSTVPAPLTERTTTVGEGRAQLARVVGNDAAGNVGEGIVRNINVDGSAPEVTTTVVTKPAHHDGERDWYLDSATVTAAASDPYVTALERGSGIKRAPVPTQTVTESGPVSVDAEDHVGNIGWSEPVDLAIDTQGPEVTVTTTREPEHTTDAGLWFKDEVDVEVEATDPAEEPLGAGSGIQDDTDPTGSHTVTESGPLTYTATDNVGHKSTSKPLDVLIDATAPQVLAELPTAPHNDGTLPWFKDEVTVDVTTTDPQGGEGERASGVDPDASSTTQTFGTAGRHTFTATARDRVGHESTSPELRFAVDTAAPKMVMVCPPSVIKDSSAKGGWAALDERGGSGLATGPLGSVSLATSVVGPQTANAPAAADKVGHTATAACSYRVLYAFKGFSAPIDNGGVYNKVKAGSAVPVKFSLGGNQGLQVLSGAPVVTPVACSTKAKLDDIEEVVLAATTSGLKYDALARQYVYTWKTGSSMANTCQKLEVELADGTTHTALFKFVR